MNETRMSLAEDRELCEYEEVIERGLKTFWEVGEALLKIRDARLYRRQFSTFEDYCRERWGFAERTAYQFIDGAKAMQNLGSCAIAQLPANEAQARPLTALPSPELQREAWQEATKRAEESGKPITAAGVQDVVTEFKEQIRSVAAEDAAMPQKPDPQTELELTTQKIVSRLPMLPPLSERGLFIPTPEEIERLREVGTSHFNKQEGDSIEWARWSWNPVTGCLHGCPYCYARDIADRFYQQGFTPTFLPERLSAPRNTRQPILTDDAQEVDRIGWRNVFVCSMADLWGKWMPAEIIRYVLREVTEQDQWTYLFLTKFPWRYEEFATELPANTWVGTSVDNQNAVSRAEKAFRKLVDAGHRGVRWLSVEPMMTPLQFSRLDMFDWVVIGGASRSTQTPEFIPHFEWVSDLYQQAKASGCKVYMKTNLGVTGNMRLREYPEVETNNDKAV